MMENNSGILSKNIDSKEKSWTFLDGSTRTAVILKTVVIGKGRYLPGWRWSRHAGPMTGKIFQTHIGLIVSGKMNVKSPEGKEKMIGPGDAFEIGPAHDAWVLGDEPCIALDFECLVAHKEKNK